MVCGHRITLDQARSAIARDWIAIYQQVFAKTAAR
jgi:hypothetical protein